MSLQSALSALSHRLAVSRQAQPVLQWCRHLCLAHHQLPRQSPLVACAAMPLLLSTVCHAGQWRQLSSTARPKHAVPEPITVRPMAPVGAKKRAPRKRPVVDHDKSPHEIKQQQDLRVEAFSTAEEYDLEEALLALKRHGSYCPIPLPDDLNDVLYLSITALCDESEGALQWAPREVFLFRQGTAVFWNVPEPVRVRFLHFLRTFETGSYDEHAVIAECEQLDYAFCNQSGGARMSAGRVLLDQSCSVSSCPPPPSCPAAPATSTDADDGGGGGGGGTSGEHTALQMYAFSNALSLSVKLGMWEAALDRYIDSMRPVTEELQRGGSIRLRKQQVLRKNGELFGLRHLINLSSDCLDTPDFYWDREPLERLYQQTASYLNIGKRTRVMNEKLNHCVELADMLTSSLQDKHHVRLEWMIIALIMVDVIFEVIHFIERYA